MVKLITTIACLISLAATQVSAQDAVTKSFDGESEASVVIIDGLSKSETYGGKTKNNYKLTDTDIMTIFGKYIKTSTQLTGAASKSETARNWEAGLRYEKVFVTDSLSGFLQHKAESDPYNGIYIQRDSTDLGAKYYLTKSDTLTSLLEAGVRYATQNPAFIDVDGKESKSTTAARLYSETSGKFNESTSGKFWVEYVPNFKSSDFSYSTAEASLTVAMSSLLSLKTAYNVYHREIGPKKDTTTFTTALVAKY